MTQPKRTPLVAGAFLGMLTLGLPACSNPDPVDEARTLNVAAQATPVSAAVSSKTDQERRPTGAPAPGPASSNQYPVSRYLGKKDQTMVSGKVACYIDFVYAGEEPRLTVWDEPCAKVTAGIIDQPKLVELGWWDKLDEFQRGYVNKMPDRQVLFVEGEFSAAIYPKDETGTDTEIEVAD